MKNKSKKNERQRERRKRETEREERERDSEREKLKKGKVPLSEQVALQQADQSPVPNPTTRLQRYTSPVAQSSYWASKPPGKSRPKPIMQVSILPSGENSQLFMIRKESRAVMSALQYSSANTAETRLSVKQKNVFQKILGKKNQGVEIIPSG